MSYTEQLLSMGFSQEAVATALEMNKNNFDHALSLLLNQASMVDMATTSSTTTPSISQTSSSAAYQVAQAVPASPTTSSMLESLASDLSKDQPALDAVNGILEKLHRNPSDQTVTVLQLGGSLAPIKACETAILFLRELGYISRSGFLMLNTPPNQLQEARTALSQAMRDEHYEVSSLLESTKNAAVEKARIQRNFLREKPLRVEPKSGNGQVCTRLVFHFIEDGAPLKQLERWFEADECLSDVIHYLGHLDDEVLAAHSWELVENSGAPFWWCHGWSLSDITLRPAKPLNISDASKTLQALGLWPSAQIAIKVTGLEGQKISKTSVVEQEANTKIDAGRYLGSRPTPSQIMKNATARFESVPLGGKTHANVNRSAAARAAEARMNQVNRNPSKDNRDAVIKELVDMGFPEASARNALRTAGGDQARAVEILLR